MILGPDDPRAMRRTGTWTDRYGKEHPVMNGVRCVSGSVADFRRPDFIERLLDQLEDAKDES